MERGGCSVGVRTEEEEGRGGGEREWRGWWVVRRRMVSEPFPVIFREATMTAIGATPSPVVSSQFRHLRIPWGRSREARRDRRDWGGTVKREPQEVQ